MYIKVAARDLTGGNWVRSTGFDTVTVDNIDPTKPEMLGFNNPSLSCDAVTNSKYVTVDWSNSSDTGSGVKGYNYQINYPTTTGGRELYNAFFTESQYRGSLNEGLHQIKVQAVDNAGNVSEWTDLCNITLDTVAPDVQITAPTSTHLTGTVEIKGTVTDANPHHYWFVITNSRNIQVAGLNTVNETNSFTNKNLLNWDTSSLPEGQYTIKLEARDSANNKDSGSVHWLVVNVDHTKPTVDLQFNVGDNNFKAVFSENVNEEDVKNPENYFLNNWPGAGGDGDLSGDASISYDLSTYTATVTFTNPDWYISPEQQWEVQNIRDLAGNILATPYKEYSTPMVAPETTISGIDSDWHSTDVTVELICTDIGGSGCSKTFYSLDGGTTYQEGNTVIVSAEGENKITYYSKDKAGNEETPHTSDSIKIDKTAPVITLDTYNTDWTNGDITVNALTNEGTLNSDSHTFTENGSFDFIATDRAGNSTTKTVTITNIDKTNPTVDSISISNGLLTVTSTDTHSGVKSVEVRINGGEWITYTLEMNLYSLVDNTPGTTHTVNIRVTDNANNTTTSTTSFTIPTTEVLGASTGPTPTKPTTTKTNVSTYALGIGSGKDTLEQGEEILETTSIEEPSVLGERCENKKKVSICIYR